MVWLANPYGSRIIRAEVSGAASEAELLGVTVAEDLLGQGADLVLKHLYEK